jgi:hypothetical protein
MYVSKSHDTASSCSGVGPISMAGIGVPAASSSAKERSSAVSPSGNCTNPAETGSSMELSFTSVTK